jgi:HNH endonuclease/AP2 domain
MITQERLKDLLHYDTETGVFTWIVTAGRHDRWKAGRVAGSLSKGYLCIRVDGKLHFAHRLAWLYVYGEFPPKHTDHINGDKSDNRISNLRACSSSVNMHGVKRKLTTNTTGHAGVSYDKTRDKYAAYAWLDNKKVFIGRYGSLEEAVSARKVAELDIAAWVEKRDYGKADALEIKKIKPKPVARSNNKTGFKNVSYNARTNKYEAGFRRNGKWVFHASFPTAQAANLALIKARQ